MNTLLSNTLVLLAIIIGVALAVVAIVYFVLPYLIKKNVPVKQYTDIADKVLSKSDEVMEVVKEIFPNNAVVNITEKILKIAEIGVKNAEQLCKIQEITKDQRKDASINYVTTVLKENGVEVTDDRLTIIKGAVEAAVFALGHTPVDVKELQDNLNTANQTISTLQGEKTDLLKKIDGVKASVL